MPIDYLPILIFFLIAVVMAFVSLGLPYILGPHLPNKAKSEPIESGKLTYGSARRRVPLLYYMVAMLFILFDIEVLFFYPWAVLFWDLKWYGMAVMGIFTVLLIVGFLYEWKKGAMEWE